MGKSSVANTHGGNDGRASAICHGLARGSVRDRVPVAMSGGVRPKKRTARRKSAPPEILELIHSMSVRDAAATLGLSSGTIQRIRRGYWPRDDRSLMRAWTRYQGHIATPGSAWFMRRVYGGGTVRHAGRRWVAAGLAAHVLRQVNVARTEDGHALLAQTITRPVERFVLEPMP